MKRLNGLLRSPTNGSPQRSLKKSSLLLAIGCAGCAFISSALAGELRASLAKADITPSQPVKMAGYESRKEFSQGVHDPLGARALVLEHDGKHLVLVSLDNLGFYNNTAQPLREAILTKCQLEPSELFLCAIHDHSAPTLSFDAERTSAANVEYTEKLKGTLAELVGNALRGLEPAQVSLGLGSSPVGVNRREVVHDSANPAKIVLGRNPSAATDREVQVLKVTRGNQSTTIGAVFVYSTHSTSLGPRNYLLSGDVHGLAEQFLERYFGDPFVGPGFAGASGNIDPWIRVLPDFRTNNGWLPEPVLMGTMLGEEVGRVLESVQYPLTNTFIRSAVKTVALPAKQSANPPGATKDTVPFNVTVGCLGEIAFVGWGGEVFNEVGRRVKDASPFRATLVITHCNGAAGYVPLRSSYAEGGYEVQSSPFGPGADEILSDETLRMLREIQTSK